MKYLDIEDRRIYLDERYTMKTVSGSGLSLWGFTDGSELIMRCLNDDERQTIDTKPIVSIRESGAYYFETDTTLKKFVAYIDIRPEHGDEITAYSRFYTMNHSILKGINRMEFIQLCTDTLRRLVRDNNVSTMDVHRMTVVCSCFGGIMNYQVVPSETIVARADFIISDDK